MNFDQVEEYGRYIDFIYQRYLNKDRNIIGEIDEK